MEPLRVLILGGTTEARILAERLAGRADLTVTLSLAGRTEKPAPQPVPTRVGGFGGTAGLSDYLRRERIALAVDATHPYAAAISRNAAEATRETGVPLLAMVRTEWERRDADRWTRVPDVAAAIAALGETPRRVLLTIGRQEASAFAAAPQHAYVVRSVDPVVPPLDVPDATHVLDRGPFSLDQEKALLLAKKIDVLVSKNSGGEATYAKIEAARQLGIEMVMIERPERPQGVPAVKSVEDAVLAIDRYVGELDPIRLSR